MGTRQIEIDPVTRIEGHAKIIINLSDSGDVSETRFSVLSFRGFERFLVGTPVESLPNITSRICGICYTSHHLTSVQAIENAWDVSISETSRKLRKLLLAGQFIESHALSLAVLSLPDLLYPNEKPENRNIQFLLKKHEDLVKAAIKLRQAGSNCTKIIGRRAVHPISAVIGGMAKPVTLEERANLQSELESCKETLVGFRDVFVQFLEKADESILNLGNIESDYFGMHDDGKLSFDKGRLRLIDPTGAIKADFPASEYFDYIHEEEADFSYMKFPKTKEGSSFRVGPLARVNIATEIPTPLASEILSGIENIIPRPWNGTMLYHFARLIELVFVWETAIGLLADPEISSEDVIPEPFKMKNAEGIGITEAPRGTLIHNYVLSEDGFCEKARFVVATQHNNMGINESLHETAVRLVKNTDAEETELNKLEMIVRAYDPCLSCATHELNQRDLIVEIRNSDGQMSKRWF
ncbi:MAG: Ni/Fe hydrogenase subunit alpha [bacterium]|nr:Ni/Fe hydrogenase subunit alpha [bacterium]